MDDSANKRIDAVILAEVPHLYANSFVGRLTGKDFILGLEMNGRPVGTLNLGLADLKILAEGFTRHVAAYERASGRKLLSDDESLDILERMDEPDMESA